jgi:hypothetical protein
VSLFIGDGGVLFSACISPRWVKWLSAPGDGDATWLEKDRIQPAFTPTNLHIPTNSNPS